MRREVELSHRRPGRPPHPHRDSRPPRGPEPRTRLLRQPGLSYHGSRSDLTRQDSSPQDIYLERNAPRVLFLTHALGSCQILKGGFPSVGRLPSAGRAWELQPRPWRQDGPADEPPDQTVLRSLRKYVGCTRGGAGRARLPAPRPVARLCPPGSLGEIQAPSPAEAGGVSCRWPSSSLCHLPAALASVSPPVERGRRN